MKNKKALYSLSHGMYVLCTNGGGCFVDAVSQVGGGDSPLVSVAVMKKNYTNLLLHEENRFSLSIFGMKDDPKIIENFGFHSARDYEKYEFGEYDYIMGTPVAKGMIGYLILEIIDRVENDTHTLFIARVLEADKFKDDEPMTYGYYQEHKNELMEVKTEAGKTAYVCKVCGYVYYGEELPEDYECPICHVGKDMFEKK